MSRLGIFFADGCEEIEGLAVVDIIRRAKMDITTISITGKKEVTGSHQITFLTDALFEDVDFPELDGIILPGGMPGTLNLGAHAGVTAQVKAFAEAGKLVCAICAAPSVLGACGILNGKKATCHPGFEEKLTGASVSYDNVVTDGNVITSRGHRFRTCDRFLFRQRRARRGCEKASGIQSLRHRTRHCFCDTKILHHKKNLPNIIF